MTFTKILSNCRWFWLEIQELTFFFYFQVRLFFHANDYELIFQYLKKAVDAHKNPILSKDVEFYN